MNWWSRGSLGVSPKRKSLFPIVQLGLVASVAVIAIAPPADGDILVIPVVPLGAEQSLVWALQSGALAMGRGALPGSVVVRGARTPLLWPALSHGALLLNTRIAGCFAGTETVND